MYISPPPRACNIHLSPARARARAIYFSPPALAIYISPPWRARAPRRKPYGVAWTETNDVERRPTSNDVVAADVPPTPPTPLSSS